MPWSNFSVLVLSQMDDIAPIHVVLFIMVMIGALAFIVWIISLGVSKGVRSAQSPPPAVLGGIDPRSAFPVVAEEVSDRPGKFRISGVDKQTGMDVTDHVTADSAANAKVKAELRGIVVTRIERV
jgi:hypothetical protein